MKKIFTLLSAVALTCSAVMADTVVIGNSGGTTNEDFSIGGVLTLPGDYNPSGVSKNGINGADGKGLKVRANKGDGADQALFTITDGYTVTGIDAYITVNDATNTCDLTAVNIDGVNMLTETAVIPNNAATTGYHLVLTDLNATQDIAFVVNWEEYSGKNRQLFIYATVTYTAPGGGEEPIEPDPEEPADVATGLILDHSCFSFEGATGTGIGAGEGYTIAMTNDSKTYSSGSSIKVDGTNHTSIKTSNGIPNILTLPEGLVATKITIYSYVNEDPITKTCTWTVNGVENPDPLTSAKDGANPDVRTFALESAPVIEFVQGGKQCCFVVALDVTEASGIESVATDSAAAVYYTMQGVRVENPVSGNLYIRVAGGKATKMLVK